MPRKKLTRSADEDAIENARRERVTRYLRSLEDEGQSTTYIVSKLKGILPPDVSIDDYRQHIADKHAE